MGNDNLSELSALSSRFFTLPKGSKRPSAANWQNTAVPYEALQADGLNVAVVCGLDLIILDVEGPKKTGSKDGTRLLPHLEETIGRLPMAPQYRTPSGGMGLIFRNPGRHVPKCDLGRTHGIEMRTGNHFCLLPHSTYQGEHYSGEYTWEVRPSDVMDSEGSIPLLPEEWIAWFLEMTCKEPLVVDGQASEVPEHYDDTVREWIWLLSADISHPDWFQVLAIVHRMTDKVAALKLFTDWSKENAREKWHGASTIAQIGKFWRDMPRREAERAARGETMVGLSRLLSLCASHPMQEPEVPPQSVPVVSLPIMPVITSEPKPVVRIEQIMGSSSGLVKELYDHVSSISREVPAFRAAAALSIVAGVIQRTRVWPTGEAPNLLAFLVGPSSTTKSFFLEFAKAYLTAVEPKLLLPNIASETGFHHAMSECPTRTYAEDEFGKRIEDAYLNNRPNARDNVNLVLKHYQPVNLLPLVRAKQDENKPPVPLATLSVLAVSTLQTMQKLFSVNAFKSDGLASRFAYFIHPQSLPLSADGKPRWEPKPPIVQALKRILVASSVALDMSRYSQDSGEQKTPVGSDMVSYDIKKRRIFGDGSLIRETKQAWVDELREEEAHMEADELEDISAMRSRHLALIDKYAVIHAVGCGRNDVEQVDADFALGVAKWHWETMKSDVLSIKTMEDRLKDKIMHILESKSELTVARIKNATNSNSFVRLLPSETITKACEQLVADGLIHRQGTARGKTAYQVSRDRAVR